MESRRFCCSLGWGGGNKKKRNSEIAMKKQKLTHRNIVIFVDMYFEVKKETMRTNLNNGSTRH